LNGHAHAAQTVKEIETGESRADYDDVEIFDLTAVRPFRLSRAHMDNLSAHSAILCWAAGNPTAFRWS
jgi:hypothetical protein